MAATYTVRQVAEILSYSTNSIYSFLKEKRIKGVRVGRGRFRIPQSELDRLLLTKGSSQPATLVPRSIQPTLSHPNRVVEVSDAHTAAYHLHLFGRAHLTLPNIFDWFVGSAAVITGVALFLFNRSFESSSVAAYLPLIVASRTSLIAAGIGVLITTYFGMWGKTWNRVFHGILILSWSFMVIFLFRSGDIDGALIYAALVVSIVIVIAANAPGIAGVGIYITLLALASPLIPLMGPNDPQVVATIARLGVSPTMLTAVLGVAAVAFVICLWIGYSRKAWLFWSVTWLTAGVSIVGAFFYAQAGLWSRAFFLIVFGLTAMFLPAWDSLEESRSKREQLMIHGIFGASFSVLLASVFVVWIMQTNLLEQTKAELSNKVNYGSLQLASTLKDAQTAVEAAGESQKLVAAVEKKDTEAIHSLSPLIYEGNRNFRRIIFLDRDGNGLHLHPVGTFDQENYAFRDYFLKTKETKKVYVSDLFEALADQSHRKVIVIAVPLINEEGEFVGVLAGSLDIEGINNRLQQIAFEGRGEYFTVVDSQGKRLMHPDSSMIGTDISSDDPLREGLAGLSGLAEGRTAEGKIALIAYAPLDGVVDWAISLRSPIASVVKLTDQANLAVFAVVVITITVASLFLLTLWASRKRHLLKNLPNDTS